MASGITADEGEADRAGTIRPHGLTTDLVAMQVQLLQCVIRTQQQLHKKPTRAGREQGGLADTFQAVGDGGSALAKQRQANDQGVARLHVEYHVDGVNVVWDRCEWGEAAVLRLCRRNLTRETFPRQLKLDAPIRVDRDALLPPPAPQDLRHADQCRGRGIAAVVGLLLRGRHE